MAAVALAFTVLGLGTGGTLGGLPALGAWPQAGITNTDSAGTAALAFTHTYGASTCAGTSRVSAVSCSGALAPTAAAAASAVTSTDTLSSASVLPSGVSARSQVRVTSCAPVSFDNAVVSTDPMLPRYAVGFRVADRWGGTAAASYDGSTAYAASATSHTEADPAANLGKVYGLGVWFRTSSTSGGPLLEIGTNPTSTAGGDDRVLYLNPGGTVSFLQNTSGSASARTTTTRTYNDGAWHFVYVTMASTLVSLQPSSTTTLQVDTDAAVVGGGLGVGYSTGGGYWHLGWAPTTVTGLGTAWFNGSLSSAVLFENGLAPLAPTSLQLASATTFATWAATATARWTLGDSGTTTFSASLGYVTGGDACTMVDLGWTLGGTTVLATTTTLRAAVGQSWVDANGVAAPASGGTQSEVLSWSRVASGYDPDVAGLRLWAPLSFRVGLGSPPSSWLLTFSWTSEPGQALIA